MKTIKYNRVSTLTQSGNRFQLDLTPYDLTMLDKVSGNVHFSKRPEGSKLLAMVERGEVSRIVIESIDRLGRNVIDISRTLEALSNHSVCLSVRSMGIESMVDGKPNPTFTLIVQVMSAVAQMEREAIKERTANGREVAKAIGKAKGVQVFGRPLGKGMTQAQLLEKHRNVQKMLDKNTTSSLRDIAKLTGRSVNTIVRVKNAMAQEKAQTDVSPTGDHPVNR
jgi:DNA invertase Pin-like site-specific DNA recombinase